MTVEDPTGTLAEGPDNMAVYIGLRAVDEEPLKGSCPIFSHFRIRIRSTP